MFMSLATTQDRIKFCKHFLCVVVCKWRHSVPSAFVAEAAAACAQLPLDSAAAILLLLLLLAGR